MNKQELAARIWKSANEMRSKIDANEYKDYILGFVFYKFLSDKEEQFLQSQGVEAKQMAIVLDEDNKQMVTYVQNNLGYFISFDNLYSQWLSRGNDFNIGDVRDALSAFDRLIAPHDKALFDGIFDTLQTGLSKLGDTSTSQTKAVRELLRLIRDIPTDGKQGYDVLGFIYEYLIANFAANAGKKAGEFYTPHEVSVLMSQIIAAHLADRDEIQIYDPTSGSGSLLLNIGQAVAKHLDRPDRIKYFAQELKENTFNLTRMNLVMRGVRPDNIVTRNADTLEADWPMFDDRDPENTYQPLYVDAVVSNPPYSQRWTPTGKGTDPRFARFGLAPAAKADYAFLLHNLYHVRPDGIMTIVLPHGVLFRGGSEAAIRKQLIESNHIDTIIGLPPAIFFGTGIPTIVMVLKQQRTHDDVLFIDASQGFVKDGKNNKLRASDIRRIVDAVEHRVDVERFAQVVSREQIRENDYNLNIPRYVSASPQPESFDLYATMFGGVPTSEIDQLDEYWAALPGLREALFETGANGFAQVVPEDLQATIAAHPSAAAFAAHTEQALAGLDEQLRHQLVDARAEVQVNQTEDVLTRQLFERLAQVPLVDPYEAFQMLDDQWAMISADLEMIQTESDTAIRRLDPVMVTKKKAGKDVEVQDGWEGRVIPVALVQQHLLPEQSAEVAALAEQLSSLEAELEQLIEELSEEDKEGLGEVLNPAMTAFAKAPLKKAVTALRRSREPIEEGSPEAVQLQAMKLLDELDKFRTLHKSRAAALETAAHRAIESLTDEQVEDLLVAKWIEPLMDQLHAGPSAVLRRLGEQITRLREKYATSMGELTAQIETTERELSVLVGQLRGSDTDNEALDALCSLLGGSHE